MLRSDAEDKAVWVVDHPSGNGDELTAQPLAVCTAVASGIETAEDWTHVEMLARGTPTTSRCGSPPQRPTAGDKELL